MEFRLPRFSRTSSSANRSSTPSPERTRVVPPRVRSLARGNDILAVADRIGLRSEAHGAAALGATLNALTALEQKPSLATVPFRKVHLLHAIYPAGSSLLDVMRPGSAALRGVQIGQGSYVRDSAGRLHIYAMAYIA